MIGHENWQKKEDNEQDSWKKIKRNVYFFNLRKIKILVE